VDGGSAAGGSDEAPGSSGLDGGCCIVLWPRLVQRQGRLPAIGSLRHPDNARNACHRYRTASLCKKVARYLTRLSFVQATVDTGSCDCARCCSGLDCCDLACAVRLGYAQQPPTTGYRIM
jgi:hypothetical protein